MLKRVDFKIKLQQQTLQTVLNHMQVPTSRRFSVDRSFRQGNP